MNAPLDDAKFVVAKSLTEDGRIGKISDARGVVVLRPMLAERLDSDLSRDAAQAGRLAPHRHPWGERRQSPLLVRRGIDTRPRHAAGVHFADAGPHSHGRNTGQYPQAGKEQRGQETNARRFRIARSSRRLPEVFHARQGFPPRRSRRQAGRNQATAEMARRLRGCLGQRIARFADRQSAGRPQRAALGRLSQGERRDPRPDRPHDDRRVVRQSHQHAAGRRIPFPAAAGCLDQRLRDVDRRQAGRGRRRRKAAGPRDLRSHPPREARSGLVGMDQRQSVQSPRLSHRTEFRKTDKDRLYASFAATGEQISLHLRLAERSAAG